MNNTDGLERIASTSFVRRLLARTCAAAAKHKRLEHELANLLKARYGISPNDVDCDDFIECVDYGNGTLSLDTLDADMTSRGYPPNAQALPEAGRNQAPTL